MGVFEATFRRSGFQEFGSGWMHPDRIVNYNEVIYVVKGVVKIYEDDRKYELHKGDCITLEKGRRHGGWEGAEKDVGFYWVEFDSDTDFIDDIKNVAFGANDSFITLVRQLVHIAGTLQYPKDACDCYVRLLLNEMKICAERGRNTVYPVCGIIAEWVQNNCDQKIDVDDIADMFGYNKDYISRAFKKNFGMNLKEYIDAERLKYIKGLLMSTSYPLKQIAQMTGFSNYKSFLKFFSYHSDKSPNEYRKQLFGNGNE